MGFFQPVSAGNGGVDHHGERHDPRVLYTEKYTRTAGKPRSRYLGSSDDLHVQPVLLAAPLQECPTPSPICLLIRWSLVRIQHGSPYKNPCFGGGFCSLWGGWSGAPGGGSGPDAHEKAHARFTLR